MASIKQALKNRTSYTTKHGLTISYEELRAMKRLNDQLDYYKKTTGVKTGERIKIGSLANSSATRVKEAQQSVRAGKYVRITQRIKKSPSKALEIQQKRLQTLMNKEYRKNAKYDFTINISTDDITRFKEAKLTMNLSKLRNYKDNLLQTIHENFDGVISDQAVSDIIHEINELGSYELHQLASNNPELLDYIYYDPDNLKMKVFEILDAVASNSLDDNAQVRINNLKTDLDNMIDNYAITKHSALDREAQPKRKYTRN